MRGQIFTLYMRLQGITYEKIMGDVGSNLNPGEIIRLHRASI